MNRPRTLMSFDYALKRLLRSEVNFPILEGFLSELLKEEIKILHIAESETQKEHILGKYNRVDIKVINDKGVIILIELQHDHDPNYFYRIVYGSSKAISESITAGASYEKITRVISISILHFALGQGKDYIYKGTNQFFGIHYHDQLELTPAQQEKYALTDLHQIFPEYYLLRLNNFNDVAKEPLDQWIYFLKHSIIEDDFNAKGLKEAQKALNLLSLSPQARSDYEQMNFDLIHDAIAAQDTIDVARIEGEQKGRIEGEQTGILKGRIEGKLEGKLETARQMKALGIAIELICQATELTPSQLEADPFFKL